MNDGVHPNSTWWSRPCGGREVFALALPLVISTGSWSLMHFVDRMFLLWHNTEAMAASMPAGLAHFTLLCFPLGLATYVNTFVAQYKGAGRPERIGLAVWQGVRIGLWVTPLFILLVPLAPHLFAAAGHHPKLAALEAMYFQTLCFGAGAAVMSAALASFFTGRGQTRVVMVVDVCASLLNIVLDYLWIFGHFGFPAMGIEGAGWATAASQWFKMLVYWWLMMRPVHVERYGLRAGTRFDAGLMWRLIRFGSPNGLHMLVEVTAFTALNLLVGALGPMAMAATTLAFNVNSVAWVPMIGTGIAVATLVGQQLGRNRPDLAARATWTAYWMGTIYMGAMALVYVLVPDLLLLGHRAGTTPDQFDALRDLTVLLLRFVAVYCVFDAMNMIFVSALKGAGDMRFVLLSTMVVSPMPVLAVWLGISYFGLGLLWSWTVVTGWMTALGIIYLARFLQGRWKTMRVIEPEYPTEPTPEPPEPAVAVGGETL
ncbi:MAG: MATE family efflux transporter [Thermoguttaceae bacterium]|jgi:MATE family multidrug resistance protein|nr:MATE family efflux transporter [Thermoguttaceae bacterium]